MLWLNYSLKPWGNQGGIPSCQRIQDWRLVLRGEEKAIFCGFTESPLAGRGMDVNRGMAAF